MKKMLSVLLVILLAVSLLPDWAPAYAADDEDPYAVWVNGEKFSPDKLTISCGKGTAELDPNRSILILNDATITEFFEGLDGRGGAIYSRIPLEIVVSRDCSINLNKYQSSDGIQVNGDLKLSIPSGSLSITTTNGYCYGIFARNGNLTMDLMQKLIINSAGHSIAAYKDIVIDGQGSKTINAGVDTDGIYSSGGNITIKGSGAVTINAGYGIYAQSGKAEIAGSGDVTITSGFSGIYSSGDVILSGSGNVSVSGTANEAVFLEESASELKLNCDSTSVTLSAGEGKAAVYNDATGKSPVTDQSNTYKCVTGEPNTSSVIYRKEHGTLSEADCTTPSICAVCQREVGSALGHLPTDADCTNASYCERCNVTLSQALGHEFPNAWEKYDADQHMHTCVRCKTEVEYADHKWNSGEVTTQATHLADGVKTYICTECGASVYNEFYT